MSTNQAKDWQSYYGQAERQKQIKKKIVRTQKLKFKFSFGEKFIFSILTILVLCFGMILVSTAASSDTLNRQVQTLENDIHIQKSENENLVFEIKELSSPERITSFAKENGLKIQGTKVKRASNN